MPGDEQAGTTENAATTQTAPPDFETWLQAQNETVKGLLDGHTKGLKSALDAERDARKGFEKQVRELAKAADAGSAAQKQLTEMADAMTARDVQMQFYDEAHSQGVSNLKLAYLAATDAGLIDQRGRVNWEQMKKSYPELFEVAGRSPRGDAGTGTGSTPGGNIDMNTIIRRAAGR